MTFASTALPIYTVSRNFAHAVHVVALTCLAGAALQIIVYQIATPQLMLWPALLALLPITVGLILLERVDQRSVSILTILAGAASVYGYAFIVDSRLDATAQDALVLPSIALIMAGASGVGPGAALRSCMAGYLAAQIAANIARLQVSGTARLDTVSTGVFLITIFVLGLAYVSHRRSETLHPRFQRAATDDLATTLRYRLELKAAALMHDTVLNHLSAIAGGQGDRLPPALAERIESDLKTLASPEWLHEPVPLLPGAEGDWRRSPVYTAVREARALGLEVGVTGDTAAVMQLDCECATELGRAVKQCLVNVQKHSGTLEAEVAIYGAAGEVLVMVVDTGEGFDTEPGSDRMGLRTSIRGRIESVGGSVQLWSTRGRGTSVVLRVPTARVPVGRDDGMPLA